MALSEYDKTQFANLTADFTVEDATALKSMDKRDKASEMSFIPIPHLHDIPLAASIVALFFMIAGRVTGNDSQMFAAGAVTALCLTLAMMLNRQNSSETAVDETAKE